MINMNQHPLYEQMNTLYDKGEVKHAAFIGMHLLEELEIVDLVSPVMYEVLFDNKRKNSFYVHVVTTIIEYAENELK